MNHTTVKLPLTSLGHEPIECVILDLFGVVISFDDSLVYDRLAQHCEDPPQAFISMRDLVSESKLIRGNRELEDVYARLVADHGLKIQWSEFREAWLTSYSEPMPGMKEALVALSNSCRLVLLSNVDMYYWQTVKASMPELAYFAAYVLSFEQGTAKPESSAFNRALVAAKAPASRCMFVDDKQENIEAAQALGIRGHLFRSTRAMKIALREAGVPV